MDLAITIGIAVFALAATLFSAWKSGRPPKDTARTQWISWPLMIVVFATVLVFAVIHAANLMGVRTGSSTLGRYGL